MVDGFHVNPEDLRVLASKVADYVSETAGKELSQIEGGSAVYGHDAVHKSVVGICEAVGMSVDVLRQTCESAGESLLDSARQYQQEDHSAGQPMSQVGNDLAGGL